MVRRAEIAQPRVLVALDALRQRSRQARFADPRLPPDQDYLPLAGLASLRAARFLPEIWLPDTGTECRRRLVARRNQVVRHRTRIKNEVHAILHAHLVPAACFLLADPRPSRPPDC